MNIPRAYDKVSTAAGVLDYMTGVKPNEVVNEFEQDGHDYILLHALELLREALQMLDSEAEESNPATS